MELIFNERGMGNPLRSGGSRVLLKSGGGGLRSGGAGNIDQLRMDLHDTFVKHGYSTPEAKRMIYQMEGAGFFDFVKKGFNKVKNLVSKGVSAYNKYKPMVQKAVDTGKKVVSTAQAFRDGYKTKDFTNFKNEVADNFIDDDENRNKFKDTFDKVDNTARQGLAIAGQVRDKGKEFVSQVKNDGLRNAVRQQARALTGGSRMRPKVSRETYMNRLKEIQRDENVSYKEAMKLYKNYY